MEAFFSAFQALMSQLGATVGLPIIIFIFGLVLGAKPGRAFRAAITIGLSLIHI